MAILLVGCIALLAVGGAGAAGQQVSPDVNASNEPRERLEMPTLDGPDTYAGNHTWLRLWSGDTDEPELSEPLGEGSWGFEATLAAATDAAFRRPLHAPAEWNAQNVRQYSASSLETSRYPTGTTVTDGAFVRDAFVAVYAIDPSTILHTGDGTTRYVGRSGRVHAVSDFRISTGRGGGTGPVRTAVESVGDIETDVTLLAGGRRLDSDSGGRATLEFSGLSGTERLRVEAEIRAELRIETRRCSRWNGSTGTCEGDWDVSHEDRTTTETVTATRSVTVDELGASHRRAIAIGDADRSRGPSEIETGSSVSVPADEEAVASAIALEPSGHWSAIEAGPNASLGSHLRFYSRSPAGWRTMVVADAEGRSRRESRVRPLELHAYPGPDGLRTSNGTRGSDSIEVRRVDGERRAGPQLGETIDLAVPSRYQAPEAVVFSAGGSGVAETVTISGIVPGRERTVALPAPTPAHPVDLDLDVSPVNETHTRLLATVTDAWSGRQVSTGYIEAAGGRHEVSNGTVSLLIEEPPRRIEVRYRPASWLTADRIYRSADGAVERSTGTPDLASLIDVALWMALSLSPIALAILGLDRATDGRLLGITGTEL